MKIMLFTKVPNGRGDAKAPSDAEIHFLHRTILNLL